MEKKPTQRDIIRDYLLKGNTITPLLAYDLCHTIRLSAIIFDLRHDEQLPIRMSQPKASEGKPYAEYWIDKSYFENKDTQLELFNE